MARSDRTALYRLFNAEDELLYIGISWQPLPSRMNGHILMQSWWAEVHHATAIWFESREEADQAETEAIKSEHPKYNIAKTGMSPSRAKPRRRRHPGDEAPFIREDADGLWIRVPPWVQGVHFTIPTPPGTTSDAGGFVYTTPVRVWPPQDGTSAA